MRKVRLLPIVVTFAFVLVFIKMHDVLFVHFERWIEADNTSIHKKSDSSVALAADDEEGAEEDEPKLGGFDEDAVWSPGAKNGPERVTPMSGSEMERTILQNLAERRKELDAWSESIAMKENILNATEKKINQKLEELEGLKLEVSQLLGQYNEKESKKIQRLVKMYEN